MCTETQKRADPETVVPVSGNIVRRTAPPEDKRVPGHAAPTGKIRFRAPAAGVKLKEKIVKGPAVSVFDNQQKPADGHFRAAGTFFFSGLFADGFTDPDLRRMQAIAHASGLLRGGRGANVRICSYL
ncbi:MAG: hypothetical protein K6G90_02045 [Clostridia bacterium]|nr:hypothetical protein [Clostridia bacterium]